MPQKGNGPGVAPGDYARIVDTSFHFDRHLAFFLGTMNREIYWNLLVDGVVFNTTIITIRICGENGASGGWQPDHRPRR